jgi:microcystin-dependent protein
MECYLGEIRMFAGTFAPKDWAFCNGQILISKQYPALYSILGAIYGGDGNTTFALPDLRGKVPLNIGGESYQVPNTTIKHTLGKKSGNETITLSELQIPAHQHTIKSSGDGNSTANLKAYNGVGNTNDPSVAKSIASKTGSAMSSVSALSTNNPTTTINGAVTGIQGGGSAIPSNTETTGGNQPISIMQPYLGINFIICIDGIYPEKSQ